MLPPLWGAVFSRKFMRPIKFKAWDKNNKRWLSDGFLIDSDGILCLNDCMTLEGNYELVQFTGLKDSKGKEIYDGDICKGFELNPENKEGFDVIGVVSGARGGFILFSRPMVQIFTESDNTTIRQLNYVVYGPSGDNIYREIKDIEVIGNIYDTPKLI